MYLLLVSTLICILDNVIPILITYITAFFYLGTKDEAELRKNLIALKQEISCISMVDEFSKYAKLQRKYNKLGNTLKDIENERLFNKKRVRFLITYSIRAVNVIFIMILLYKYNNEPVIKLPKDTLWPINNLLKWPTDHDDSISLIMWFMITILAISKCTQIHVPNNQ